MGLRCSLMGHDFGESEIDREREERGDEVIITIREVETCERCGAERVHSENTEVRPVEPIADVEGDGPGDGLDADTSASDGTDAAIIDEPTGASDVDETTGTFDAGETTKPSAEMGGVEDPDPADAGAFDAADTENPATDPETDDGVILDDEETEEHPERTAGEWPDAEDTRVKEREGKVPEAAPEPEADAEPNSEDAPAAEPDAKEEDAEILGASSDEASGAPDDDVESDGPDADTDAQRADARTVQAGDWPEQDGVDEGFDAEPGGEKTDVEFSGIAPEGDAAGAEATPSESPSLSADSETNFVCPECGFAEVAAQSSLRAGDICPDCRKGYLREK